MASGVRRVAQKGGDESSYVESPEPRLLGGVDLDSRTGLYRGLSLPNAEYLMLLICFTYCGNI